MLIFFPTNRTLAALAAICLFILQTTAGATFCAWNNTSVGDWFISGNWVHGVPTAGDEAFIGNGTALINAPSAAAQTLVVGAPTVGGGATGTLLMGASGGNTGTLTVQSDITIGTSAGTGLPGNGTVTVSAGAFMAQTSGNLNMGSDTQNSTGTLNITGLNSLFQTSSPTFIGAGNSHGNFTVQNGAGAFTGPSELANDAASSGVATVTGAGSVWYVTGGFTVGYAGSGTVNISSGGELINQGPNNTISDVSVAAFAGSTGSVTVTGTNSEWVAANLFLGGRDGNSGAGFQGGSGSLNITSGGYVQVANVKFFGGALQVDNGSLNFPGLKVLGGKTQPSSGGPVGDMVVGNSTQGRMEITQGGTVICGKAYVGIASGSAGYAYVSGNNSSWNLAGSLFVANQGDGTLEIRDTADVSTPGNIYIGFSPSTVGNVIMSGHDFGGGLVAFSNLGASGNLYIGGNTAGPGGSGVLRLEVGAAVNTSTTTVYSHRRHRDRELEC